MTMVLAVGLSVVLVGGVVVLLAADLVRLDREQREQDGAAVPTGPDGPDGRDAVVRLLPHREPDLETRWTGLDDLQWERYLGRRSG